MTYAHVTTERLATSAEVHADVVLAAASRAPVSDQTARTIATWWQAPAPSRRAITSLAQAQPFDTEAFLVEVTREITDIDQSTALINWAARLAERIAENDEAALPLGPGFTADDAELLGRDPGGRW
jgi:hypothetical protein